MAEVGIAWHLLQFCAKNEKSRGSLHPVPIRGAVGLYVSNPVVRGNGRNLTAGNPSRVPAVLFSGDDGEGRGCGPVRKKAATEVAAWRGSVTMGRPYTFSSGIRML